MSGLRETVHKQTKFSAPPTQKSQQRRGELYVRSGITVQICKCTSLPRTTHMSISTLSISTMRQNLLDFIEQHLIFELLQIEMEIFSIPRVFIAYEPYEILTKLSSASVLPNLESFKIRVSKIINTVFQGVSGQRVSVFHDLLQLNPSRRTSV